MQQPFRRRYNKFSCKVTKKNGNLSAFKYLFAPQCRNDPAFFASKAVRAMDTEDIAEVRSDGAPVVDKIRPFVKKRMSPREETNVPSRRDENYKGARNAYFPPTDEDDTPHEVGEAGGLCCHVGPLAESAIRRPKSAARKKARLVAPCHKGIGRHWAEDRKGPAGVGFCSEDLARSKKSGTFVPSS